MRGRIWHFLLQREGKSVIPIPSKVVTRSGRHYLPPFSTEGDALDKILLKESATESWSSVLVVEKRKRGLVLKLFQTVQPPVAAGSFGTVFFRHLQ